MNSMRFRLMRTGAPDGAIMVKVPSDFMMKRLIQFVGLCLLYTGALVMIHASLRAQENPDSGEIQINFEYRVF